MPARALNSILARLIGSAAAFLVVVALSFLLMRLAPGGPFDSERPLDPHVAQNLRRVYKLDLPLPEQFWLYLKSLARGDFGPSLHWRDFSVGELLAHALPISLRLGAQALALALLIGGALGVAGALRGRVGAFCVAAVALAGVALPAFVVGPLLQLGFGLRLRWLPVGGWEDGAWRNQVLPTLTLALPQIAIVARLMQAGMRDALAEPYVRTLRAFGLPRLHILARAARAGALPTLSYLGLAAASLLTGSVAVETIFGVPGMGRYFVEGALGRDYPLVMGTVVVVAAMVIAFNLLVDLAYMRLDPRIGAAR
ncbi:ABC transporter permease [Methylocella sp.]|uniref:ABC transporter permease n=1 Tax=Methylocella sp. TaxID=1978226 RepID=UPI0035B04EAA